MSSTLALPFSLPLTMTAGSTAVEGGAHVLRYLVQAVLVGFLLVFGVNLQTPYPMWIIHMYDIPIVRFLSYLSLYVVLSWDVTSGILFALSLMFIHIDMMVLGQAVAVDKNMAPL